MECTSHLHNFSYHLVGFSSILILLRHVLLKRGSIHAPLILRTGPIPTSVWPSRGTVSTPVLELGVPMAATFPTVLVPALPSFPMVVSGCRAFPWPLRSQPCSFPRSHRSQWSFPVVLVPLAATFTPPAARSSRLPLPHTLASSHAHLGFLPSGLPFSFGGKVSSPRGGGHFLLD